MKKTKILNFSSDFHHLFRYATFTEKLVTVVNLFLVSVVSLGIGLSAIGFAEVLGITIDRTKSNTTTTKINLLNYFGGGKALTNATSMEISEAMTADAMSMFYLNVAIVVAILVVLTHAVYKINILAFRQTTRLRKLFIQSILSQDMAWFDTRTEMDIASKITSNIDMIKDAIGEKLVTTVFLFSAFFWQVVIAFLVGWKLALAMTAVYTVLIIGFSIYVGKSSKRLTEKELQSYSKAGAIAEEVFDSIRTVKAFNGETKESQSYAENLKIAEAAGIKKSLFTGLQSGLMWFLVFACFGAAFCYGIQLMIEEFELPEDLRNYNLVSIVTVVFCMVNGAQFVTLTIPSLETIASARAAIKDIYEVIDRKSKINPFSEKGKRVEYLKGNIEFKKVNFQFPLRKDTKVLRGVSFCANSGQTVAIVGHSGCGKSTCLQLLQRFYDVTDGEILVDGINIQQYNLGFLRSQIGVVNQEPVLFSTSIAENIRFGNPEATQSEIEDAAKIANCHSFISKLPQGYDTVVGEKGAQLSGGQKQRIAIARAIVRNPAILLLDEATSALDAQSEKLVQKALDKALEGRTTLIVSHRLSTIRNADYIIVLDKGKFAEVGTHNELMSQKGIYHDLRMASQEIAFSDLNDGLQFNNTDKIDEEIEFPSKKFSQLVVDVKDKEELVKMKQNTMKRLIKISLKDWKLLTIGCICSIIVGASYPISGVLNAEIFEAFETTDLDRIHVVQFQCGINFLILATVTGIASVTQTYVFGKAGVRLTSLLRNLCFKTAIKQNIAWYDHPCNAVGALSARLSTDCANVQGATGIRLAGILQATSSILIGVIVGSVVFWKLTLVVSLTVPLLIFVAAFESLYAKSTAAKEKETMENASRIAIEAIMSVRTVASLGQEKYVLRRFIEKIEIAEGEARKSTKYRGLAYSLNISMSIFAYGVTFIYAGHLISTGEISLIDALMVIEAIIYGAWMMGIVLNTAPNVNSALTSAANIMDFIDTSTKSSETAQSMKHDGQMVFSGDIEYKNIKFSYPNRPETEILKGLDFRVDRMKTVAIVGPSGCGKSTCFQLLLRFYDPNKGKIAVDGAATTEFPLSKLRAYLSLVSQEPVLFDCTIAENIAYGDNSRDVPLTEVIEAAKEAQIHKEFVTKLPLGYATRLGSRGTLLSGGQKQRIAIARALIRKPKVLLLDEATSALDAESEKTVQDALNRASENRTCLIISHRLSSIRNANLICVMDQGKITEMGTHDELINANGIYSKLYRSFQ